MELILILLLLCGGVATWELSQLRNDIRQWRDELQEGQKRLVEEASKQLQDIRDDIAVIRSIAERAEWLLTPKQPLTERAEEYVRRTHPEMLPPTKDPM